MATKYNSFLPREYIFNFINLIYKTEKLKNRKFFTHFVLLHLGKVSLMKLEPMNPAPPVISTQLGSCMCCWKTVLNWNSN